MAALLITAAEAKKRLQLTQEMEPAGQMDNLAAAVVSAQFQVEVLIDSKLAEAVNTDIFFLDSTVFSGVRPEGVFRLYLKTGLVKAADPVVLMTGGKWNLCTVFIPQEDFVVDRDKGIVFLDEKYADTFVSVAYESGITPAVVSPPTPASTPDWLRELIMSYLPVVFYAGTVNTKDSPGVDIELLTKQATDLSLKYRRKNSFCLKAMA